ncbi:PorE family type IX secretion system protein [Marinifilum sp. RC60d5]|uniref:PorE family type IX secretion system protein n=1 Tax=Marinifilum sp. RC60d5 TaxID=3458414 RepID=UPI00403680F3
MKLLPFAGILCSIGILISCSSKSYVNRGDKMVLSGRYYHAQAMYKKGYKKQKDKYQKGGIAFKSASCFDKINEPRKAASWYRKAIMNRDTFADAVRNLAYAEVKNGKLEEAEENFWEYLDLKPEMKETDDAGKILKRISYWQEFPGRYKVQLLKDYNSSSSDFAPVYMGKDTNVVFFTSNRKYKDRPKKDGVTGEYYTNIYQSHYSNEVVRKSRKKKGRKAKTRKIITDTYQWSKPEGIGDTINTEMNEGASCFTSDGDIMYFTSSKKINKDYQGTKIYAVQRNNGEWGRTALQTLVPDSISAGHPSISGDGTIMYFISDMPGGYGGNDIWMSKKSGSGWSQAQNLGKPINTPSDELFPYIRNNGMLYFASDREGGMGGLDIYQAQRNENGVWLVDNMKYPINSTADDFAIHFQEKLEKGMFTSSRRKGDDNIYRFDYVPLQFTFSGQVIDSETKKPVEKAKINLVSSDGEQSIVRTDKEGKFFFELKPDLEYIAMVSNKGYLNGKELVNTLNIDLSRNFKSIIGLKPIEKPIELPNIFYDFGSWSLREESKEALDGLVETLNDNPKITIELGSHSDFVGSKSTNKEISQKRAQSVVDYLIDKGIYWDRLVAQGYGESQPRKITAAIAKEHNFLKIDDILTESRIEKLNSKQKEIANQLNRRTEFKVLSTDYMPGPNSKVKPGSESGRIGNTLIQDLNKVEGVFYTVQIGAFDKKSVPVEVQQFEVVFRAKINDTTTRYTTGIFDDLEKANAKAKIINKKGIKAFVIAYNNGKKITFAEAKKLKK